jgi:hypothetical protein
MMGDRVGSNILAKIMVMELGSKDGHPGQEVEIGFCLAGQDILTRGDRNHWWRNHKNK